MSTIKQINELMGTQEPERAWELLSASDTLAGLEEDDQALHEGTLLKTIQELTRVDPDWVPHAIDACSKATQHDAWRVARTIERIALGHYETNGENKGEPDRGLAIAFLRCVLNDTELWREVRRADELRSSQEDVWQPVLSPLLDDEGFAPDENAMRSCRSTAELAARGDQEALSALLRDFFEERVSWPARNYAYDPFTRRILPHFAMGLPTLLAWIGDPSSQAKLGFYLYWGDRGHESAPAAERWLLLARAGGEMRGLYWLARIYDLNGMKIREPVGSSEPFPGRAV